MDEEAGICPDATENVSPDNNDDDDAYEYSDDFSEDFEDPDDDDDDDTGDAGDAAVLTASLRAGQRRQPPGGAATEAGQPAEDAGAEDAEMDDVLRAMQTENSHLVAGQSADQQYSASERAATTTSAGAMESGGGGAEFASRMNFKKAKATARNRATGKNQRRWADLAKMVELHSVPFTLFEQVCSQKLDAQHP